MGTTSSEKERVLVHCIRVLGMVSTTLIVLITLLWFVELSVRGQVDNLQTSVMSLQSQKESLERQILFVNSDYFNEKIKVDILKSNVDGATVIRFDR
jgi:hypothetical protein